MLRVGPVMPVVDGDVAGAGAGHGADDGEGMDAGVAGVELDGLGFFGWRPPQEQPTMMAMLRGRGAGELRLGGGLAGGDDGELSGAVGGGDDAGVEVLDGGRSF